MCLSCDVAYIYYGEMGTRHYVRIYLTHMHKHTYVHTRAYIYIYIRTYMYISIVFNFNLMNLFDCSNVLYVIVISWCGE